MRGVRRVHAGVQPEAHDPCPPPRCLHGRKTSNTDPLSWLRAWGEGGHEEALVWESERAVAEEPDLCGDTETLLGRER